MFSLSFARRASRVASLARDASTLVLVESNGAALNPSTLSAFAAAQKLGGDVTALVASSSSDASAIASQVAAVPGVKKVLVAANDSYKNGLAESLAPLIVRCQESNKFSHIIAPHTSFGKNILPRVCAKLDVSPISDVIQIQGEDTFQRPIYAGNAIADVKSSDNVKVLSVRTTAFPKVAATGGSAAIENLSAEDVSKTSKWVKEEVRKSDRPDLSSASVVIAGGRALKSAENFKIIEALADKLGGAVGASRAAVDAGYAPNDLQVGQTGKVVAPELYVAVGISGAIQHLAGMKDSKTIVAINKDKEAPIFQVADIGLVADLFDAVPAMTAQVQKK